MPLKRTGPATDWETVDRWDHGVGWIAHPEERLRRASHAVEVDGDVWVVDPVDVPGLDDLLAEHGDVAGVLVLLDRHSRDAGAVAARHDVPVYVPEWMSGVAADLDAPVERVRRELGDTGYGVHRLVSNAVWQEGVLYGEDSGTLYVPEALGTADHFLTGSERVGVHPMLRLTPPRTPARFDPDRLLLGHGAGVHDDPGREVRAALDRSRSTMPGVWLKNIRNLVRG